MTKGRPPAQALKEARAIGLRQGRLCENHRGRGLFYDFAIHLALLTIYVRVKRIRIVDATLKEITALSYEEIRKIRRVPPTIGLFRELWVRCPKGTWRFFIVLDDQLVEVLPESRPENLASTRPLRENAPGPDRSSLTGAFPVRKEMFVCPFMAPSH